MENEQLSKTILDEQLHEMEKAKLEFELQLKESISYSKSENHKQNVAFNSVLNALNNAKLLVFLFVSWRRLTERTNKSSKSFEKKKTTTTIRYKA